MANGGGGTVPTMPAAVWNAIKDETWERGGWDISGTVHWLHEKAGTWGLYATTPARWTKATMEEGYWDNVAGGTLETQGNWILVQDVKWYVYFYDDDPAYSQTWQASR